MALNTAIRGAQIQDNVVDENHLTTSVAGVGITGGNGSALAIDLNELSAVAVDVSADEIAIVDATDSSSKKESIADLITAVAGDGLSATSGVLAIDLNELTGAVIDVSADSVAFLDATDSSTKLEAVADIVTAIAGVGLTDSAGVLAIDLNELPTEATFDASADYVGIVDATDSGSDKTLWSVIATAIAGSGITATNGVLSADAVADNIVEGDIQVEDESANCNGITVAFTLSSTPITNSVQVYLNGLLQQSGSGKDYTLAGTTVTFVTAPETNDILLIHYIINN